MREIKKEEETSCFVGAIRVLAHAVNKDSNEFSKDAQVRGVMEALNDVDGKATMEKYRVRLADYFADQVPGDVVCSLLATYALEHIMPTAGKAVILSRLEKRSIDETVEKIAAKLREEGL